MGPAISDHNMWLILLSVIQLSGGHCIEPTKLSTIFMIHEVYVPIVKVLNYIEIPIVGALDETTNFGPVFSPRVCD